MYTIAGVVGGVFDLTTTNPSLAHFFESIGFDVFESEDSDIYQREGPSNGDQKEEGEENA